MDNVVSSIFIMLVCFNLIEPELVSFPISIVEHDVCEVFDDYL